MTAPLALLPSEARQELRERTRSIWREAFAPPIELSLPEIADRDFYLSPEFAPQNSGPFRTDRVPYVRGILNALWDEDVREVTFQKPAQVGGTVLTQVWLLGLMAYRPAPIMMGFPGEKALKKFSQHRLSPMLRDCEPLRALFRPTQRRESDDTIAQKLFPGGFVTLITSKSTAELRSTSAPNLIVEEADEWEGDVGGQGDAIDVFRARARTFETSYKIYKNSTPTLQLSSRIIGEMKNSSQAEFYVPCPHCHGPQVLRWKDPDGRYRLVCERDAANAIVPESARYLCEHCGVLIEERFKERMLLAGSRLNGKGFRDGWKHAQPGNVHVGFHIETVASPLVSWATMVTAHQACGGEPTKLKAFDNTWRGLPWKESLDEVNPLALRHRQEVYPAEVPDGVGVLTSFTDVQGDRLELFVYGWGVGEEGWLIRWEQLDGNPAEPLVWQTLDHWLFEHPYRTRTGARLGPMASGIDANYLTSVVHGYCGRRRPQGVFPTIGRDGKGRKLIEAPGAEKYRRGRDNPRSHIIGTDTGKDMVVRRLAIPAPGPGYLHFPQLVDGEPLDATLFDHFAAESREPHYVNGHRIYRWVKDKQRRNEGLDGLVGALAALYKLGPAVLNRLPELAAAVAAQGAPAAAQTAPGARRGRQLSEGL